MTDDGKLISVIRLLSLANISRQAHPDARTRAARGAGATSTSDGIEVNGPSTIAFRAAAPAAPIEELGLYRFPDRGAHQCAADLVEVRL